VCNICFSAIFSGFECGLAYPFPLMPLDQLQQHLNRSRHLVVASANAHHLHLVDEKLHFQQHFILIC